VRAIVEFNQDLIEAFRRLLPGDLDRIGALRRNEVVVREIVDRRHVRRVRDAVAGDRLIGIRDDLELPIRPNGSAVRGVEQRASGSINDAWAFSTGDRKSPAAMQYWLYAESESSCAAGNPQP
jgi:hypothetical protein